MLVSEVDQNDLAVRMQAMELQTHELREQIAKLENSSKQKEVPKLKLPSVVSWFTGKWNVPRLANAV